MKVIAGEKVFELRPDQPIAVFLSKGEKEQIAGMIEGARLYAQFDEADPDKIDDRIEWCRKTRKACER